MKQCEEQCYKCEHDCHEFGELGGDLMTQVILHGVTYDRERVR